MKLITPADTSDAAFVVISGANSTLQVVMDLTQAENDGVYHFYDIDLSGFEMTDSFVVGFYSFMGSPGAQWHIDDVELAAPAP